MSGLWRRTYAPAAAPRKQPPGYPSAYVFQLTPRDLLRNPRPRYDADDLVDVLVRLRRLLDQPLVRRGLGDDAHPLQPRPQLVAVDLLLRLRPRHQPPRAVARRAEALRHRARQS